jgi:hypothetical protein
VSGVPSSFWVGAVHVSSAMPELAGGGVVGGGLVGGGSIGGGLTGVTGAVAAGGTAALVELPEPPPPPHAASVIINAAVAMPAPSLFIRPIVTVTCINPFLHWWSFTDLGA